MENYAGYVLIIKSHSIFIQLHEYVHCNTCTVSLHRNFVSTFPAVVAKIQKFCKIFSLSISKVTTVTLLVWNSSAICAVCTVSFSDDTLNDFIQEFGSQALESINSTKLKQFIDEHFAAAGTELESCQLTDWQEQPPKLMQIKDPKFRQWALELNLIWKKLCRRVPVWKFCFNDVVLRS